jgi:CRISPR/Cas system-associated exonuclease Cas4 (RecB family)
MPYISKSRISKWLKCEEKFNLSYLKGYKEPTNFYMRRGTAVHEAIEDYYEAAAEFVAENDRVPTVSEMVDLLPETRRWADYTEPFITNFLLFEARRGENAPTPTEWLPVAVEAEEWLDDPLGYGDDAIPWMGYADAIYPASGFPEIDENDGVVIVDFKTGKTPNKKYREEGIYLEGEYYAMLFASEWDVAGVAGYYPKNDDLIVSPLKESRREKIESVVHAMQAVSGTNPDHLPITEQPLCKWGPGKDEQCAYYDMCASTWGEGLKHEDRFRRLAETLSDGELADEFGMDFGAVRYTKSKLGI